MARNIETREGYEFWDRLNRIPKYGFLLAPNGDGVHRAEGIGNWIDRHEAQVVMDDAQAEVNELREQNAKLEAEAKALREEVAAANDRADTLEHRMMGMMTRHFAEAWSKRDTEKALDGYLSAGIAELERERDAALAEVARIKTIADNYYALCVEREQELAALRSHDFHGIIASTIGDNWREEVDAMRCELRELLDEGKES